VDGINSEPLVVDSIQIFAGQRYSFVLEANQTVDNYWIRAQPNTGNTTFDGGLNSAILRYSGAPVTDPTTTSNLTNQLLETNLHPLQNAGAPGGNQSADVAIHLNMTFDTSADIYVVNGAQFVPPTAPVLLQILSGAHTAQDLLPAGSVYTLPPNKVIEVSIPGLDNTPVSNSLSFSAKPINLAQFLASVPLAWSTFLALNVISASIDFLVA
jgi:iron transport multicopper oxidase